MDRHLRRDLSELAEDGVEQGWTPRQFIERLTQFLDEKGLEGDPRTEAKDFAHRYKGELDHDVLDTAGLEADHATDLRRARDILNAAARQAVGSDWLATIQDIWPAPIAHELERLLDVMLGENVNVATADTALSQYRDSVEVLIKFTAAVFLKVLIESDRHADSSWARSSLHASLSVGSWISLLREAARRVGETGETDRPATILARAVGKHLMPVADKFAEVRNTMIGHGARALDASETAELIASCVLGGRLKSARGDGETIKGLFPTLAKMVEARAFEGMNFSVEIDGTPVSLNGLKSAEQWIEAGHDALHPASNETHGVTLQIEDQDPIGLAPLVAARVCRQCARKDVILYDALNSPAKGGVFDLIDYARGHKSRYGAEDVRDLSAFFADLPRVDRPSLGDGRTRSDQRVIEALERARFDRNYVSPAFMREAFVAFLEAQPKGIFWLQAPAHVGKTTFVQGLAEPSVVNEKPLLPRFANRRGGCVIPYYIRKEIRSGRVDFINTLERRLMAYFSSDTTLNDAPRPPAGWFETAEPSDFAAWLAAWRAFAIGKGQLELDAPFILAVDGLDEAETPGRRSGGQGSMIGLLPAEEELPDGLYILLTSRLPDGDDEVPAFLQDIVVPKYASSSEA